MTALPCLNRPFVQPQYPEGRSAVWPRPLDPADAVAHTIDVLDSRTTVTRTLSLIAVDPSWSYGNGKGPDETVWTHARTFLRIDSEKIRDGVVIEVEGTARLGARCARRRGTRAHDEPTRP